MTYLVLARKWRPQVWEDVVAQDHVTATLKNAIAHDRLAHAYLFTGPRGVGKTSAARILAKALNCEKGPTVTPCNQCSACVEITEGRSVDVFEIDGASNRGIDEVRNLRENIRYAPAGGKNRIYIIDEVHMLTNEAFNALLKTLEEPPEHVLFIFATTEPHKVPATIVSRCQRFDFHRISTPEICRQLKAICSKENIEIDEDAMHLIARKADGSLRDSQSILDQMISFSEKRITADLVVQALGLIDLELFFQVTDTIISGDVPGGLALINDVVSRGYDIGEFMAGLAEHLRNLLVIKATHDAGLVESAEIHRQKYMDTAGHFVEEDLMRLIHVVADASMNLKRSLNPRFVMEMTIVKLIRLDKTVRIEDLLRELAGVKPGPVTTDPKAAPPQNTGTANTRNKPQKIAGDTEKQDPADTAGPDAAGGDDKTAQRQDSRKPEQKKNDIDFATVQAHWDQVLDAVRKKKITVGSFLQEGVVTGVEGNVIQIGFGLSNGFHIDAIVRSKSLVMEALQDVFREKLDFHCVKQDMPDQKKPGSVSKKEKMDSLRQLGEKQPAIKKIIDDFDAEIIDRL